MSPLPPAELRLAVCRKLGKINTYGVEASRYLGKVETPGKVPADILADLLTGIILEAEEARTIVQEAAFRADWNATLEGSSNHD